MYMHIYIYATIQSANIYVPAPVIEAENRTMTKGGKDLLSGAGIPVEEVDEKHKHVTDGGISNIKNNQVG